ncbi:ribosomal protein L49/IMG2, partial [Pavlovales sp. CCMP2436]
FKVYRSNYNELPVYHDYKNGRTRRLTLVRKYVGDTQALVRELVRVCEQPQVYVRTGRIEIKGLHKDKVVAYFESLGF